MGLFSKKHKESASAADKEKKVAPAAKVEVVKKKEEKTGVIKERGQAKEKGQKYVNLLAHKILFKPLITEKSNFLSANNQYVFEVAPHTNKVEVAKAIEHLYDVKPIKVNIIKVRGKKIRYGRQLGKMKNWKKAVITLKAGEKINVYEGV